MEFFRYIRCLYAAGSNDILPRFKKIIPMVILFLAYILMYYIIGNFAVGILYMILVIIGIVGYSTIRTAKKGAYNFMLSYPISHIRKVIYNFMLYLAIFLVIAAIYCIVAKSGLMLAGAGAWFAIPEMLAMLSMLMLLSYVRREFEWWAIFLGTMFYMFLTSFIVLNITNSHITYVGDVPRASADAGIVSVIIMAANLAIAAVAVAYSVILCRPYNKMRKYSPLK